MQARSQIRAIKRRLVNMEYNHREVGSLQRGIFSPSRDESLFPASGTYLPNRPDVQSPGVEGEEPSSFSQNFMAPSLVLI